MNLNSHLSLVLRLKMSGFPTYNSAKGSLAFQQQIIFAVEREAKEILSNFN